MYFKPTYTYVWKERVLISSDIKPLFVCFWFGGRGKGGDHNIGFYSTVHFKIQYKPKMEGYLRMKKSGIAWKPCEAYGSVKHNYVMSHCEGQFLF